MHYDKVLLSLAERDTEKWLNLGFQHKVIMSRSFSQIKI